MSVLAPVNSAVLTTTGAGVPQWSTLASDTFTQYALLSGRAGGQSLMGGTVASENLTLDSTANATKGLVLLAPSGGNVGIGTTAPTQALEVVGEIIGSGKITSSTSLQSPFINTFTTSSLQLGSNGTYPLVINSAGNVGVGTAAPVSRFHSVSGVIADFSTASANANANLMLAGTDPGLTGLNKGLSLVMRPIDGRGAVASIAALNDSTNKEGNAELAILTGGGIYPSTLTERMRINTAGNVGIGTTAPVGKLDVWGTSGMYSSTTYNIPTLYIKESTTTNGHHNLIGFSNSAGTREDEFGIVQNASGLGDFVFQGYNGAYSEKMRITSAGNVGIGTTSPGVSLDVGAKTDAIALPKGTTAEQPASPVAGWIRYNTSNSLIEFYNGTAWTSLAAAGSGITALTGDITASGSGSVAATVAQVGGVTAANVASGASAANAATNANTISTLVKRDASGNFSAGTITANLTGNVSGTAANVTGIVAIANGGTGQTTATGAFNALAPTTTVGDLIYANGAGTNARLIGNSAATKMFLAQTGTGAASAAPVWGVLAAGDIPSLDAAKITTGVLPVAQGGTSLSTYATGDLLYASAANTLSKLGAGTNTHVLTLAGGLPVWQANPGGSPALSSLSAATAINSINNGANPQTWNWALTANNTAFSVGETAASSGGSGILQNLVKISTLASSTANPLYVTTNGGTPGLMVYRDGNVGIGNNAPSGLLDVSIANTSSGNGKSINLTAQTTTSFAGSGGAVTVSGGAGNSAAGGGVTIQGGGGQPGGAISLSAGGSSGTTVGAGVTIAAANGSAGGGGNITLTAGNASGSGAGGSILLSPGAGTTNQPGVVGIGTTTPSAFLHTQNSSARTTAVTGVLHNIFNTSSTASLAKVGMNIESTGTWNGASATNTGLLVNVAGGTTNYSAVFTGGNVGIGTTSPESRFHVVQDANAGTGSIFGNSDAGSAAHSYLQIRNGAAVTESFRAGTLGNGFTTSGRYVQNGAYIESQTSLSGGLSIAALNASAPIRFYSGGGTERMRLDSTGNVGIGTTTPGAKLEISSGVANTSGLKFTNFTSTAPTGTGQAVGVDASGNLITVASGGGSLWTGTEPTVYMGTNTSSDKVGINVTVPTAALDVRSYSGNPLVNIQNISSGQPAAVLLSNTVNSAYVGIESSSGASIMGGTLANALVLGFSSANPVQIMTSGAPRMAVLADGNVGIGTTTPSSLLTVGGNIEIPTTNGLNLSGRAIELGTTGYTNALRFGVGGATIDMSGGGTVSGNNGNLTLKTGTGGGAVILQTVSAERMRVDTTGNVGIGTTAPGVQTSAGRTYLSISGSTSSGFVEFLTAGADADLGSVGGMQFTDKNSVAADKRIALISSNLHGPTANNRGGALSFYTKADGASGLNSRMTIDNSGNVGIGTTNPAQVLHISAASNIFARIDSQATSRAAQIEFVRGGTNASYLGPSASNTFDIGTNEAIPIKFTNNAFSERMRIDSSGNVGIGTTTPGAMLDVAGHVANSGATAAIGTCGTSPVLTGNDTRGEITLGTGSPTACTVTFSASYTTAPYCVVTANGGDPGAVRWWISTTINTLVVTFSSTPTASQKFHYHCMQ
jgi:hypothetical protein